jgi:pimeloyl-ACP methyl ester carboxylesterase
VTVALWHEQAGNGPPVVFVHPGIADSRVWDPQWASFARRFSLVRCDLPGFGRTPIDGPKIRFAAEVAGLLDALAIADAALVGCSLGGRIALELAVARPELVSSLVLVGAGLPGWAWSEQVQAYGAAEDEAVSRGDFDTATELNLRMWVDGPGRTPADVDPAVRAAVGEMERRALELQARTGRPRPRSRSSPTSPTSSPARSPPRGARRSLAPPTSRTSSSPTCSTRWCSRF